jgi:8-oxo-dGTP diphosphatase
MAYTYDYPRPMVTVDIVLLRYASSEIEILLIRRKQAPFQSKWALPGGYLGMNERLSEAARRELFEETGVNIDFLFPFTYADQPDRDPRGRTISFIFGGILSPPFPKARAGDDAAGVAWYPLQNLPGLAFDHGDIIQSCRLRLERELHTHFLLAAFLPHRFTRSDLKLLYQEIFPDLSRCSEWLERALEKDIIKEIGQDEFERIVSLEILYSKSLCF